MRNRPQCACGRANCPCQREARQEGFDDGYMQALQDVRDALRDAAAGPAVGWAENAPLSTVAPRVVPQGMELYRASSWIRGLLEHSANDARRAIMRVRLDGKLP